MKKKECLEIFDTIIEDLIIEEIEPIEVIYNLASLLEDFGCSCLKSCDHFNNEIVNEALIELHPNWIDD